MPATEAMGGRGDDGMSLSRAGPPRPTSTNGGRASLADAVQALSESGVDPAALAGLLGRVVDLLGDDKVPIDDATAGNVRRLLTGLAACSEPEDGQVSTPATCPAVRGLASQGLIRLCVRTRDESLPAQIEEFSKDAADAVRECIAEDLPLLFGADPALADRIAARYASGGLPFLPPMPCLAFRRELAREGGPPINKAAFTACTADPAALFCCIDELLSSALDRKNARARDLLDHILADARIHMDIRLAVMHAIGKSYLFEPRAQGRALEVFLLVLDSEDPEARENAAFILTSSIDTRAGDPAAYVKRIAEHIDRMAGEAGRDDCSHKMLETLTSFLRKHCNLMPERALGYLERVAALPELPQHFVITENTVDALGVLLRTHADKCGRRRCIRALKRFARSEHPGAIDLVYKAGRLD